MTATDRHSCSVHARARSVLSVIGQAGLRLHARAVGRPVCALHLCMFVLPCLVRRCYMNCNNGHLASRECCSNGKRWNGNSCEDDPKPPSMPNYCPMNLENFCRASKSGFYADRCGSNPCYCRCSVSGDSMSTWTGLGKVLPVRMHKCAVHATAWMAWPSVLAWGILKLIIAAAHSHVRALAGWLVITCLCRVACTGLPVHTSLLRERLLLEPREGGMREQAKARLQARFQARLQARLQAGLQARFPQARLQA